MSMESNAKIVWNFFKAKGLSDAAVAGILGNLQQESGIDPEKYQLDGGPGRGIAQWTYNERWRGAIQKAKKLGKSVWNIEVQLEFMWDEMNNIETFFKSNANTTFAAFCKSTNVALATDQFEKAFERAGDPKTSTRISYAIMWFEKFKGKNAINTPNYADAYDDSEENSRENKKKEDGATDENFYKYFNNKYIEITDDLAVAMMDELVKIDPLRRIEPLSKYDYISYGHRYYNTMFNLTLGDSSFVVPPQFIMISSTSSMQSLVTLRQDGTQKMKSGYTKRSISVDLVFHGVSQINGYQVEGPGGYYYVDGLRQLLAQFKLTPFLPIENFTINNTYNIHTVALQSIVCSTVDGFPDMITASVTLQEVDLYPYIENHTMYYSEFIDWDLFRFYYQRLLTESNEHGKLQSIPVNKTLNKFKISILDNSIFNYINIEQEEKDKAKDFSFDANDSFYSIALDEKIVRTEIDDEGNEVKASSNYITYINSETEDVYISSFQSGYSNKLTNVQMAEQAHPTIQYMGGMDTIFNIIFETTDSSIVTALERCNIKNNKIMRDNKDYMGIGFIKLESELVSLFGAKYVMIENVSTNTVPDFPGLFNVQISCVSYDLSQFKHEGINGINPFYDEEKLEKGEKVKRNGTKSDAIEQSPLGLYNKIKQDVTIEDKLRNEIELYPDLRLPKYSEVDKAIAQIKEFRATHTNANGEPLSQIEYDYCPRTPQRMLHGLSGITGLEIDKNGFVKNVPEIINSGKWYEGYVDPDFYVFYPETYKRLIDDNTEDLDAAGVSYKSEDHKPKAKTTTITRTQYLSNIITDSDISTYDYETNAAGATELQSKFIALARTKLGKPYSHALSGHYNRVGPNAYDCSGLISSCLTELGILQGSFSTKSVKNLLKSGVFKEKYKVNNKANIKELIAHAGPGDLLHIYGEERGTEMGHIAIYTGNNKMIHSTKPLSEEREVYAGFMRVLEVTKLSSGAKEIETVQQTTTTREKVNVDLTLQEGDTGEQVKELQVFLNRLNNAGLNVDGIFGPLTTQAVKDFQSKHDIEASGRVDKKTSKEIETVANEGIDSSSSKSITISGKDSKYITNLELERVAKTIANIQLGKPYTAQVALAQLIYDRLMDPNAKYGNLNTILSDTTLFKGEYTKSIATSTALKAATNVFCKGERQFVNRVIHYCGIDSDANILKMNKTYEKIGDISQFAFWGNKKEKTSIKTFELIDSSEAVDKITVTSPSVIIEDVINTGVGSLDASFAKYFGKPIVVQTKEMMSDSGLTLGNAIGAVLSPIAAVGTTATIVDGILSGKGLQTQEHRYNGDTYNTPEQILMTSFVNQCEYAGKGRMIKGFPTYVFCVVDEDGNWLDGRKLWANYYMLRSLVEIQVVSYNDNPVNTATVTVTNSYGNLDTLPPGITYYNPSKDDEYAWHQRALLEYFGILPSFGPKLTEDIVDRKNIIYKSMIVRPGCRMHLRMGYGSDPLSLPVVMNGFISDLSIGDITTFVCISDGVELTNGIISDNPKDVNGIFESQEASNITIDVMTKRQSWINRISKKWGEPSKYGIEHFGLYFTDRVDVLDWSKDMFGGGTELYGWFVDAMNGIQGIGETILTAGKKIGDGLYFGWKTVQYDIIKNIYRSSYDSSLAMYTPFLGFKDKEKNLCFSTYNKTPWDAIQMGVQNSPEYVGMPFYHQFESRIFLGLPFFLAKYRYDLIDGVMFEESKSFAQAHFIDSLTEIVDNQMVCNGKDISTNAIVMYTLGKSPKATPTLYSDKTINYSMQSTKIFDSSVSQNLIGPDALWQLLGADMGKEGACRVGVSQLLYNWEKAYQGDLILLGDAGISPYDYLYVNDRFNDLTGVCTARTVIHSLSANGGFLTTVTPGLIGFATEENSQAQTTITNIVRVGTAFSYHMALKKLTKDNSEEMAEWYNNTKALTSAAWVGGFQLGVQLTMDYVMISIAIAGILKTPGDVKKFFTALKAAKTGAKLINGFRAFSGTMRTAITSYKAVKGIKKFGGIAKLGLTTVKASKLLMSGGFKAVGSKAGLLAGPVGALIGLAIGTLLDILIVKFIDYFRWNNVLVLLPMMHKKNPFAPITSGKKLLLIGGDTGNLNTEETSTGEGDPGDEDNQSKQGEKDYE